MRVVCTEQRTHEWFKAKLGIVSASSVWKALHTLAAKSKNGGKGDPSGKQLDYLKEKAIEIITGVVAEHFVTKAMDKGTEYEPRARAEYLFLNDVDGDQTGFVLHPTMDRLGASPDLLLPNGGAEFKCPLAATHMDYLDAYTKARRAGLKDNELAYAVIPDQYIYQVQTNIVCCEREWWDWASFVPPEPLDGYPPFPEKMRLLQVRMWRDEEKITEIERGVEAFNERLLLYVEQLREVMG